MKFNFLFLCLITILACSTAARADDDLSILKTFAQNLKNRNYNNAAQYVSSDSGSLFEKYANYDLGNLTPTNLQLVKETSNNNFRYMKVLGTDSRGRNGMVTIALVTEQDKPKVDLPESMRLGFGNDWQQKINLIEQSYLFAKQNLGDQQSRQLLYSLLQKH